MTRRFTHPNIFLPAVNRTVSSRFTNFAPHSHTCLVYFAFGMTTSIRVHNLIVTTTFISTHILTPGLTYESARITSILPKCALPFLLPTLCVHPMNTSSYLYAKVCILVYDRSFLLPPLPCSFFQVPFILVTKTYHFYAFFAFCATLHFLVYSSHFSICCNSSGVHDIATKSSANINHDTEPSPTWTPFGAASTATVLPLINHLHMVGEYVLYILVQTFSVRHQHISIFSI